MDRTQAKAARIALENALGNEPIGGFVCQVENGSYDDTEVTFRVSMRKEGEKSKALKDAEQFARLCGFNMSNARGDKIVGYKPRSPKYPWVVEKASGGRYKYTGELLESQGFKKAVA